MKKTYLKSVEMYKPSLTQKIHQFFRCLKGNHIWRIYDVVEDNETVGELKTCTHCGESINSFNI
jgi:transcription elongation factor Elf1